jgi:hypothetical protein
MIYTLQQPHEYLPQLPSGHNGSMEAGRSFEITVDLQLLSDPVGRFGWDRSSGAQQGSFLLFDGSSADGGKKILTNDEPAALGSR